MKDRYTRLFELAHLSSDTETKYTIADLAKKYGVSEMTIRRDLKYVKSNVISQDLIRNIPVGEAGQIYENYSEKVRIAQKAASLIEADDVIIIDSGTTTCLIPQYLDESKNITVLCYNYQVLSQIYNKENISLIFSGGYFHRDNQVFESADSINLIRRTRANKFFVSAAGVHRTLGMTCFHSYEVATKQAVLDSASEKILVADSTKFDKIRPNYYAPFTCVDTVITDDGLSRSWQEYIEELGIKLYLV